MKILKKAEQKNFIVDDNYYTKYELDNMISQGLIVYMFEAYRIYAENCTDVKVICDDGYYNTVVITKTGKTIHIEL